MGRIQPVASCLLLLLLAACAHRGGGARLDPAGAIAPGGEVFQAGVASWYGEDFHGRTTANGEVYDMNKLTAAHPSLPFDTLVEVESLANGQRVLVRVNDRGPFLKGRVIDLSRKAARRLGMEEPGTAEVRLRVLRWGGAGNIPGRPGETGPLGNGPPPAPAAAPPPQPETAGTEAVCFVQAGAFAERQNAEDMLLTLGEILPGMAFRVIEEGALFKVVSPALETAAACDEVLRRLAAYRLPGFIRRGAPER